MQNGLRGHWLVLSQRKPDFIRSTPGLGLGGVTRSRMKTPEHWRTSCDPCCTDPSLQILLPWWHWERRLTDGYMHTHRQKDGTDSITSTADAGGKNTGMWGWILRLPTVTSSHWQLNEEQTKWRTHQDRTWSLIPIVFTSTFSTCLWTRHPSSSASWHSSASSS